MVVVDGIINNMEYLQYPNGVLLIGDCLEWMDRLEGMNVDMVLADLPYGTTQNKWDSTIPLHNYMLASPCGSKEHAISQREWIDHATNVGGTTVAEAWEMWKEGHHKGLWHYYEKHIKENAAIVLTAQTPFDKVLGASNLDMLRYEWIWQKTYITGHLNANRMPLKNHENILVFYKKLPTYNPQFTEGEPYYTKSDAKNTSSNYGKQTGWVTDNKGTRHPKSVLTFGRAKGKYHPTQKPVDLFRYLIRTYTNEGDTVLDNTMGSGTTAVACELEGRRWVGIEKEPKYVKIIDKRLSELNEDE